MKGIPTATRIVLAALAVVVLLTGSVIGYRIGKGAFPRPDSSALSAGSAFLALLLSLFVWFQTRSLQKPTERPIIAITAGPSTIPPRTPTVMTVRVEMTNTGTHAATDLRTRVGFALQSAPQRFQALYDDTIANRIEPQHRNAWQEDFAQYMTADACVYYLITYRDALTRKAYYEENWSKYDASTGSFWHALTSEKQRLEEYVRAVYPLPKS